MNIATPTSNGKQGLTSNLRQLVDEADQFLSKTANSGDQKFEAVREEFTKQIRQMRSRLDDLEEGVVYKARRAVRSTDQAIHDHPYGAMGAVATVGMLIGFLVSRR